jgi:hypothetical protein
MQWLLLVVLVLLTFTMHFVTLGNGSAKATLETLLTVAWVAVVAVGVIAVSWMFGALLLILTLPLGVILRPLAARLLRSVLTTREGGTDPMAPLLPFPQLSSIAKDLDQPIDVDAIVRDAISGTASKSSRGISRLLALCQDTPQLHAVLNRHGIELGELAVLYRRLCLKGAGQWVSGHYAAASALAYPHTLDWFLARRVLTSTDDELHTAYALVEHFRRGRPLDPLPSAYAN